MEKKQQVFEKADLIIRYLRGELNPLEEEKLEQWIAEDEQNRQFIDKIKNDKALQEELHFFSSINTEDAWSKVSLQINNRKEVSSIWQRTGFWKYAAAILIMLALGIANFHLLKDKDVKVVTKKTEQNINNNLQESERNKDKIKLTLADGSVIILQDVANGTVWEENGGKIIKKDGQVTFQFKKNNNPGKEKVANILSTPIGGQYQIVLPDGSKVWLNSASSLRFPAAFTTRERTVELTGEAYFEVAKNKNMPFKVKAGGITVEVLGTHFNVMAYAKENSINTTLLEGSVKVNNGTESKVIVPGQQARVTDTIQLAEVDLDEAIAWKNGLFQFNNTELKTVMREIERWYHVDITYEGRMVPKHFTGQISRNTGISQVLKMLELSGEVHFKMEERRITVLSK